MEARHERSADERPRSLGGSARPMLAADRDGFVDRIKSAHPNVKVVSVQYGAGDHLKSTEIAKSMLQAYPNLKGIFGANEGSAEGVAIGVKESGKKLVVIGYDSGKEQKEDVTSGLMAGAITQNPVCIG